MSTMESTPALVLTTTNVAVAKLRSARACAGFILAAVATAGLGAALQMLVTLPGVGVATDTVSMSRLMHGAVSISPVFVLLLAVVGTASEFRHGTASTTLLLNPRRPVWLAGQAIASMLFGVLLYALAVVAVVAVVLLAALSRPELSVTAVFGAAGPGLVKAAVVVALYGLIGTGVALLIADQTGAIAAVLIWVLVVETMISSFAPAVGRFLPGALVDSIIGRDGAPGMLSGGLSLAILCGYAVVLLAGGAITLCRRDIA